MKFNLHINQKAISESGLKLDIYDACILDFIHSFFNSPKIQKKMFKNKVFGWYKYSYIAEELPLLDLKKDTVYRRIKEMINMGLLETHPDNQSEGKSFFHQTEKLLAFYFDPTDGNPTPPRMEIRTPTDAHPYHYNINDNTISLINIKDCDLFLEFIETFNNIRKSKFKPLDKLRPVFAKRLKTYSKEDILHALTNAMSMQYHIDNKFNDLTPEFLLREEKLEKYLNYNSKKESQVKEAPTPVVIDHRNRPLKAR